MIDPITALAAATAAFNGVQKLVNAGREIEDVTSQLGKWFTAVSDIREAGAQAKKPSIFKKIVNKQSVEEEALNALIAKKKAAEQESQIRELIIWRYGMDALREMYKMRREIAASRQAEIYAQQRRLRLIQDGILIALILATGIGAVAIFIWLVSTKAQAQQGLI